MQPRTTAQTPRRGGGGATEKKASRRERGRLCSTPYVLSLAFLAVAGRWTTAAQRMLRPARQHCSQGQLGVPAPVERQKRGSSPLAAAGQQCHNIVATLSSLFSPPPAALASPSTISALSHLNTEQQRTLDQAPAPWRPPRAAVQDAARRDFASLYIPGRYT